jgi:hypothetical protein
MNRNIHTHDRLLISGSASFRFNSSRLPIESPDKQKPTAGGTICNKNCLDAFEKEKKDWSTKE